GTFLARPLLHHPLVLLLAQWGLFCLECLTPIVLVLGRRGRVVAVIALETFHLVTQAMIRINFVPLMVCLVVFLPLEDIAPRLAVAGESMARRLRLPRLVGWGRALPD